MKITYLTFIFFLLAGNYLLGQATCYEGKANLLGVASSTATVDSFACVLTALAADEAGATPYKSYSVADYSIAEFKNEADVERYRIARYDSLTNVSPYRIIFWWEYVGDNPFGHCRVSFTYPEHDIHNNCFSDLKIGLIEGKLQARSDSLTASGGLAIGSYTSLEASILDLAIEEVEKVKNCCNAAEPENRCDACLVGDELDQLKEHYYIYRMIGDPKLNYAVNSARPSPSNVDITKNQSNYIAYVNDVLPFEGTSIDLYAEYQEFLALGDTICDFPVIITDDEVLCNIELEGWDNGDRTVINIASDQDGNFFFELSEYTYEDCYLFFDFMNDRHPEVFGPRLIDEEIPEDELFRDGGRGAVDPCQEFEDEIPRSYFVARSGAFISRWSPEGKRIKLAGLSASILTGRKINLGTLNSFTYENEEYKYLEEASFGVLGNDFYKKATITQTKNSNRKLNPKLSSLKGFSSDKPWFIASENPDDDYLVTGLTDLGCGGLKQCYWEKQATIFSLAGPSVPSEVPLSAGGVCCVSSDDLSTVCCELGRNYIENALAVNRANTDLAERISDSLTIVRTGEMMCDMGVSIVQDLPRVLPF